MCNKQIGLVSELHVTGAEQVTGLIKEYNAATSDSPHF